MDMCYSGALVMPTNYAVMDCDEVTYVTATVDYDNLVWISSVKVRKGK